MNHTAESIAYELGRRDEKIAISSELEAARRAPGTLAARVTLLCARLADEIKKTAPANAPPGASPAPGRKLLRSGGYGFGSPLVAIELAVDVLERGRDSETDDAVKQARGETIELPTFDAGGEPHGVDIAFVVPLRLLKAYEAAPTKENKAALLAALWWDIEQELRRPFDVEHRKRPWR